MQTKIVEVQTEDKPEGTVLAQNPPPVSRCPSRPSSLCRSCGPSDQVEIPDVTGQDQLTAAATLGRNFQVETKQEESDTVAVGAVIRTDPPAGTKVARDSAVTMVISAGHPGDDSPGPRGAHSVRGPRSLDERRSADGDAVREPVVRRPTHRGRDHAGPGSGSEGRCRPHGHRRDRSVDRRWHLPGPDTATGTGTETETATATGTRALRRSCSDRAVDLSEEVREQLVTAAVSTDSGWNCTPSTSCSRWRSPMIVPSSVSAVISSTSGNVARSTTSEW